MILQYLNFYHILMILLPIVFSIGTYFLIKKLNKTFKIIFILFFMLINLVQHLFKNYIWPQYLGQEFSIIQTAYNMCALMILLDPISLILKQSALKQAINTIGLFAGLGAIIIPYWFIGQNIKTIEFVRYYFCHFLLIYCNLLCLLFNFGNITIKNFYRIPSHYILFKIIIFCNYMIYYKSCGKTLSEAYNLLEQANPIIMFKSIDVPVISDIINHLTLPLFKDIPILYSLPLEFASVCFISFIIELIYYLKGKRV